MLYSYLIMLLVAVVDARSVGIYSHLPPSSPQPHNPPAYHSLPPHASSRFGARNHCTFTRSHPLSHLTTSSQDPSDTFHNPSSSHPSRPQRLLHPQRRPQPRLRILSQLSSELDEESKSIPVNAWVHIAELLEGVVLERKVGMRTFSLGSLRRELEFEGIVLGVTVRETPRVGAPSHLLDAEVGGEKDKQELKRRDSEGVAGGELSLPKRTPEQPEVEKEIAEATGLAREERECAFRAAKEVEIKRQMEGWMDLETPGAEAGLRVSFLVYRVD